MDFQTSWITWLIALTAGASVALFGAWLLLLIDAVPPEDRRYRDLPPRGMRLMRMPIRILAHHLKPCLPARLEAWLSKRLKMAGLSRAVTSAEMAATCIWAGAVAALVSSLAVALIDAYTDWILVIMFPLGCLYPVRWLQLTIEARQRLMLKQMADFLDVVGLSLDSGRNVQSGLGEALAKSPPGPMADEFRQALAELETGSSWPDALAHLAQRVNAPQVSALVAVITNAQRSGASLGPTIRALADQSRMERFSRAEALAMKAPVKMLFPMTVCILPCTMLVLIFLFIVKFQAAGI